MTAVTNKTRVLHVINNLDHGGAEHQLQLIVGSLDPDRFESQIVCVQHDGALGEDLRAIGVPVMSMNVRNLSQWPRAVMRLRKIIKKNQIDLVHTSLADSDFIGGAAGKFSGVPVISTLVNTPYDSTWLVDNPKLGRWKLRVMDLIAKMSRRIFHSQHVAISDFVANSAREHFGIPGKRITTIYRGLPESWISGSDEESDRAESQDIDLDGRYPVLLNVGRLVPQKGQKYLIQAMPAVIERYPNATLLMVGKGFLKDELASLADDLGVSRNVQFLGTRTDIRNLLDMSDIFMFPSLHEGLGVALVEAVGAGKPAVASRVGPLPEVVEDGESGRLVSPGDPEAISDAICDLASDRIRLSAMSDRCVQIAREKFSIEVNVGKLESAYERLLVRLG